MAPSYDELLQQARSRVREVSPAEAKAMMEATSEALLIDVRELHEWDTGHIPGAIHIPLAQVMLRADPSSPMADPALAGHTDALVVTQCRTGQRSVLAADALQQIGFTNVVSLQGGILLWARNGFPID